MLTNTTKLTDNKPMQANNMSIKTVFFQHSEKAKTSGKDKAITKQAIPT